MKNRTKLMAMVAVGVLAVGTGVSAYQVNAMENTTGAGVEITMDCEEGAVRGGGRGMAGERGTRKQGGSAEKIAVLVDEGVLNEETALDIEVYLDEAMAAREVEREEERAALEEMTEEERQEFFEEKRAEREANDEERVSVFEKMYEDGVITAEELEAIEEVFDHSERPQGGRGGHGGPGGQGEKMRGALEDGPTEDL